MYGEDGEGLDSTGHGRSCTAATAKCITNAAAETVSYVAQYPGDEDLGNFSYEVKTIYRDPKSRELFIKAPKSLGAKKLLLRDFH